MFRIAIRCLSTGLSVLLVAGLLTAKEEKDGSTPLFNGKDMAGFKTFVPKGDGSKTWTVKDGVIICSGVPRGYFHTTKSYKNYVLVYDWRYPKGSKPTSNSGCLVHIQPPAKLWPKCVEPQGRYKDHGKLFFIGVKPVGDVKFDAKALEKALKPMGEWSTTEITCRADGTISVKVNGTPISEGKSELTEGPIGWQSEDAEIHFRNIKIRSLK